MKRIAIIFDGQCTFCAGTVEWLKRVNSFRAFEFYNSYDRGTMRDDFPMVRPEDVEEAMIAVTETGVVFKGFYAFRRLIWASPWLWLTAPLFYFPGSSFCGTRLYAWVARNRRKFGCRI